MPQFRSTASPWSAFGADKETIPDPTDASPSTIELCRLYPVSTVDRRLWCSYYNKLVTAPEFCEDQECIHIKGDSI